MHLLLTLPFLLQVIIIGLDEGVFHLRRGLPKWERIGHPLDTLSVILCLGFVLWVPYSALALKIYIGLSLFSCLLVTKDEFVHKEVCPASEQWLHALLFLNHPILLTSAGLLWPILHQGPHLQWLDPWILQLPLLITFFKAQVAFATLFCAYQAIYWNFIWKESSVEKKEINNAFYDELKEGWYESSDHPIALLRSENALRNPWILAEIETRLGKNQAILDIGCGAGFLANILAQAGHRVTGIDLSLNSLKEAQKRDITQSVSYHHSSAYELPFENGSFDVVCAMDFLEHVEDPKRVVQEASRALKPGGLFFFHTFNRNFLSWLVVIKGVEWFAPNTPKNMHVYPLFIKPKELQSYCAQHGLQVDELRGLRPDFGHLSFLTSLLRRKVSKEFRFRFSSSLKTGYVGFAKRAD